MSTDYPVAIVGAGPVGLSVANLLGEHAVPCILLERDAQTSTHPRAQSIDDESMRTLQSYGCAKTFESLTVPAAGSIYADGTGRIFARVGPGAKDYGFEKRRFMLQHRLDKTLLDNLNSYACVDVRFSSTVISVQTKPDGATLTLESGEVIACRYLLACDGGQSLIRKSLGIDMQGRTYAQDWVVLDTLDDPDGEPISRFICDPARPTVSVASPNGGRRYEFMLLPGEDREEILCDDSIAALLRPYREFDAQHITRRAVYTFHARIADQLRRGPVFLLGDAAHLTPPFAGQGMNAGMRDAFNIAWKLALVVKSGGHERILDSYDAERRGPIWSMIQLAVAMGEFVMPASSEQVALTNSLMQALERFPEARDWLFQMRFKPKPKYDAGLFVNLHEQVLESSLVGSMVPQPHVVDAHGRDHLLDELLGTGFCILVQNDDAERAIGELDHPVWKALQVNTLRLCFDEPPARSTLPCARIRRADESLEKIHATYARPFRTHRDQILLIRPDRYAMAAVFPYQLQELEDKLHLMLFSPDK